MTNRDKEAYISDLIKEDMKASKSKVPLVWQPELSGGICHHVIQDGWKVGLSLIKWEEVE